MPTQSSFERDNKKYSRYYIEGNVDSEEIQEEIFTVYLLVIFSKFDTTVAALTDQNLHRVHVHSVKG